MTVVFTAGLGHVLEVFLRHPGGDSLHVGVLVQQVLLGLQLVTVLPGQTQDVVHTQSRLTERGELVVDAVHELLCVILELSARGSCNGDKLVISYKLGPWVLLIYFLMTFENKSNIHI